MAPGRDDLIAANISKADAAVNSSSRETGNLAGATSSAGSQSFSAPRSRMGANLDVLAALDAIQFQGRDGDGSMRGNVAYIRRWKRGNTAQTTGNADSVPAEAVGTAPEEAISRDIAERYGEERERLGDDQAIRYNTGDSFYTVESGTVVRDEDGNILEGTQETFFVNTSEQEVRKNNLAPTVPTSSESDPAESGNVASAQATEGSGTETKTDSTVTGKLKPANPNGFINAVSRVGRNILGIPPSPPLYAGDVNSSKGSSVSPSEGMWQFLFNPSELELEAGPEFKTAETWGVSDKANSGQPLHWSHNKNALLKFNSVLLNGFVFGRKVEPLEQGLLELFMARDGDGQDGPHVLEFVWGKRVFGPCVIKNVSVKEKQWDEGEVVNAELSFTLEQVPEWTINDGFVDVARPGRQPTVASPATSSNATGTQTPGPDAPVPDGAGPSDSAKPASPNSSSSSADQSLCNWALEESKKLQQLYVRVNNPLTSAAFGNPNSIISSFYSLKSSLHSGSSEISSFVDSKVSSGCKRSSYEATVANILKSGGNLAISPQQQALQFVRGCTESTKRAVDEWQRTSPKCKAQREAGTEERASQAQRALCAKYTGRCDRPGERFGTAGQCPFVNNNRGVQCSGGVWTPL